MSRKDTSKMNLLWELDWWWRLVVIWWGWAWLCQVLLLLLPLPLSEEVSWTEAACRVCLSLYKVCVAMPSSRFLPFTASLFNPGENIQYTWATPPPAVPVEVERVRAHRCMLTQTKAYRHTHTHIHTHNSWLATRRFSCRGRQVFQG